MSDIYAKSKHRLSEKIKEDPTPVIGLAGLAGVVGYSIYHYRKRDPSIKPSVYIIQTRVIAQGIVVGALTLSVIYRMYNNLRKPHMVPENPAPLLAPTDVAKIKKT